MYYQLNRDPETGGDYHELADASADRELETLRMMPFAMSHTRCQHTLLRSIRCTRHLCKACLPIVVFWAHTPCKPIASSMVSPPAETSSNFGRSELWPSEQKDELLSLMRAIFFS